MDEILEIINEIGLPFAYDHFAEGEAPEPPFIIYIIPRSNNFFADGIVYYSLSLINIELYTVTKDPAKEALVESVLQRHKVKWDKMGQYIPEERLYRTMYEFEKEM